MILLIDNYDSFSYNLYHLIGHFQPDIQVVRNDTVTIADIHTLNPQALVLSPGPGRPQDAGICLEAIKAFAGKIPIFGVCLGHQAIGQAFGGQITYAKELLHGKTSLIYAEKNSTLFAGMESPFPAARYHSLAVDEHTLPDCLQVCARTEDGEIMALEHREYPIFSVQFHPESVMTPQGKQIIYNFLSANRRNGS